MLRKCFLVFGLFVFANLLLAQGIVFEQGTIQEAFAKAKAQNKPVFIDVYTTWCGPCKWMSKEVFTKESVGEAYNPLFVSYKMDAEADENQLFLKQYSITAYPTLLYLRNDGSLIAKLVGAKEDKQFINLATVAIKDLKEDKGISHYEKKYPSHQKDTAFLKEYISKMQKLGISFQNIFDQYLQLLPNNERVSNEIIGMYSSNEDVMTIKSFSYKNLKQNALLLFPKMQMSLYAYMVGAIGNTFDIAVKEKNSKLLEELVDENVFVEKTEYADFQSDEFRIRYFRKTGDAQKMKLYASRFCNQTLMKVSLDSVREKYNKEMLLMQKMTNDSSFKGFSVFYDSILNVGFKMRYEKEIDKYAEPLNNYAWYFFEMINDAESLEDAIQWSLKSLEFKPNYDLYLDTYANLLYKTGNKQKAIDIQKRAVAIAQSNQSSRVQEFEERLGKMHANTPTWP